MSDARSLLRQQREARRINHPHATYSDAGKLLCTACREPVKAESLWDAHIRGETHKKRVALLRQQQQEKQKQQELQHKETAEAEEQPVVPSTEAVTGGKRKHTDDEDEVMDGVESNGADGEARRKRSRPADVSDSDSLKETPPPPPPSMTRRSSGTPSQGIELQIPSRPATPRAASSGSASGTTTALPSRQATILVPGPPLKPLPTDAAAAKQGDKAVDEDEWAAFEADMAAADYAEEATISAPAMTNEQIAAKEAGEGEDDTGDPRDRKTQREADLAGEKEDAQRALEEELDEMQSLEAKVAKLKERRDALKQRAASFGGEAGSVKPAVAAKEGGKENAVVEEEDEDDSDEDEDDDGWDGFRFRTGVRT